MTSWVTSYSRAIRSQSSSAVAAAIGSAAKVRAVAPSNVRRSISMPSLRSDSSVSKIIGPPAFASSLGAVAGLDPPARGFEKILWSLGKPFELRCVAVHDHQRPGEVSRVVGCDAELAAGLELRCEQVDRAVVHHPPLRMT